MIHFSLLPLPLKLDAEDDEEDQDNDVEELLDDLIQITEHFETKNEFYLTLEKQFMEQKKVTCKA